MSTPNSRFKLLGPGILTEMVAHQTQLFYDPSRQSVEVTFNGSAYLQTPNGYVTVGNESDILRVPLTDRLMDKMSKPGDLDPVTGADLSNISIAGVLIIFKRAYDNFHNERASLRAAMIRAIQNNDISAYPINGTEYAFSGLTYPLTPSN